MPDIVAITMSMRHALWVEMPPKRKATFAEISVLMDMKAMLTDHWNRTLISFVEVSRAGIHLKRRVVVWSQQVSGRWDRKASHLDIYLKLLTRLLTQ